MLSCLSLVWLFATPWTVVLQSPLFMEFPKQESWIVMPSLGDPPDLSYVSWLAGVFFTTGATWETLINITGHSDRAPNLQSFSQLPDLRSVSDLSMWNGSWVTDSCFLVALVSWKLLFFCCFSGDLSTPHFNLLDSHCPLWYLRWKWKWSRSAVSDSLRPHEL